MDLDNKNIIAICAVGYNRLSSMKRLLDSLTQARYDIENVPLIISIDCSGDEELYSYVKAFEWTHGDKKVIIHEKRLGLKEHILSCGDLSSEYKGVIILEDDIFVSPEFYIYAQCVTKYYEDEPRIAGISLFQDEMGFNSLPHIFLNDGSDAYLRQEPSSWGEIWTSSQWSSFREWLNDYKEEDLKSIDMPQAYKNRKRAWSKYFMAYLIQTDRFVVYPRFSHTTCFSEAGDHTTNASTIGQVNLLQGPCCYHFARYDDMTKYDIYDTNQDVYNWTGYGKKELCVDWYGMNPNIHNKRYILTPLILPYEVIKSYGMLMRPIELNIKYNIEGEGIYIYDTKGSPYNCEGKDLPLSVSYYYMRMFNRRLAKEYVIARYKQYILQKVKRVFHL